jgi:hypothetical protein
MSELTDDDVTETMMQLGGAFVAMLGELYRRADHDNRAKLYVAFEDYFVEYKELTRLRKEREAARV